MRDLLTAEGALTVQGDFRIGEWLVQPSLNTITNGGDSSQLEPKVMDVLVYLGHHNHDVVPKESIIRSVWPDTFVTDDVLIHAISELRKAFHDNPRNPSFIQTIPKRGYRLIAPVSDLATDDRFAEALTGPEEDVRPYPGLIFFTAEQADYFFGRELEVEAMWEKLCRSKLLALIGPSGSGKTSFLRAGLLPAAPEGWAVVIATPGLRPCTGLAEALAREVSGDLERFRQLLHFEEAEVAVSLVSEWRQEHSEALIIIDQFEEVFTQSPAEVQEGFFHLLGKLLEDSGCRFLLSMRDDFLFNCHGIDSLETIFSDLTPIGPPKGLALRRALVEPAGRCGYRFESEDLVDRILEEVEGEKGALPLLAFAAARMWDLRDRDRTLLTEEAYDLIGGVGGALSLHAEATLEKIGQDRLALVRELFRNLVTARGTRAVQDCEELMSVFAEEQRQEAEEILKTLLDARLLVSYQATELEASENGHQRIEIVHESLLTSWKRLVRWQVQDTEGAQLRDELRHSARMWDQRGRTKDLLWAGTAFREYELWREHYPGRLTELEEAFGQAMEHHAQMRTRRRRQVTLAIGAIALIITVATAALWQRAEQEARRAEAAHLLALGQVEVESHRTEAVAYTTKSLELADTEVARRFVVKVLSQGPVAYSRSTRADATSLDFSADGEWISLGGWTGLHEIWKSDGSPPVEFSLFGPETSVSSYFSPKGYLVSQAAGSSGAQRGPEKFKREVRAWRLPGLTEVNSVKLEPGSFCQPHPRGIFMFSSLGEKRWLARLWPFGEAAPQELGSWEKTWAGPTWPYFGSDETLWVNARDRELYVTKGLPPDSESFRYLGTTEDPINRFAFLPGGEQIATFDAGKTISFWSLSGKSSVPERTFQGPGEVSNGAWGWDDSISWMATPNGTVNTAFVWDLLAPAGTEPIVLERREGGSVFGLSMHPRGLCVATADNKTVSVWPLKHRAPRVLHRYPEKKWLNSVVVDPDGEWVAANLWDGKLLLWSLANTGHGQPRVLYDSPAPLTVCAVSPDGEKIATASWWGVITIVPVNGGPVRELHGFRMTVSSIAFDNDARRLAAGGGPMDDSVLRVWDLATGEVEVLDSGDQKPILSVQFAPGDRLYSSSLRGLRSWNLSSGTSQLLVPGAAGRVSPDGRYFLGMARERAADPGPDLTVYDLQTGDSWRMSSHGDAILGLEWHPSGKAILTSTVEGVIQVGPVTGEPPHLLYGHTARAKTSFGPGGQWVYSSGHDGTLRMWPMPDLSRPPLHTLPYEELMDKLYSMTNLRVVEDEGSPTGYEFKLDDFPGWEELPDW